MNDEDLVSAILTGDLDPEEPAIAARLAGDPSLAARLAELRALARELDEEGHARRHARGAPTLAEVAQVRRALDQARGVRSGAEPRRLPRSVLALVALVVALLGVWAARPARETAPRDPGHEFVLGATPEWITSPRAAWQAGEPLAWALTLPSGGRFQISIRDARSRATLVSELSLYEPAWTPSSSDFARFPPEIEVRIEVLESDGGLAHVHLARLSVSR